MNSLVEKHCTPCTGSVSALTPEQARALMQGLRPEWKLDPDGRAIEAAFEFKDYYRVTAFVSAVAWIAHREDHHPDIRFGYRECTVRWWTHAVNGLTENDLICAAKVDALLG
jgi:4a-hydroxytetrahydrobiopterin dehydratase